MSVLLCEDDIPGSSLADRNPAMLKTEELCFGSNAQTIQGKDCGQKLNLLSSEHLNYSSDRTDAWMFILFTLLNTVNMK